MRSHFIILIFILSFSANALCQASADNNLFIIKGKILNRDTGIITLRYFDFENKFHEDTAILHKGNFLFTGTVNHVCEGFLWTNQKNLNMDDRSVFRFILEPGEMIITFNENSEPNAITAGGKSQTEKENWDKEKVVLLKNKSAFYSWPHKRDSIIELIRKKDVDYLLAHPASYLSVYLLRQHHRRLTIDSLQKLYSLLEEDARSSTLGRSLLEYIYPLTNDQYFRASHPLLGAEFNAQLSKIKSLYDFTLKDSSGNSINLSAFKGKYVVLDFWASWCSPCVGNIPQLKKLMKDYESAPIQFISISLDTDAAKWKKSIRENSFSGLHLLDTDAFNSLIAMYYKVVWVGHHVIIDKNGSVINGDAPAAGDPVLTKLLDRLVSKE